MNKKPLTVQEMSRRGVETQFAGMTKEERSTRMKLVRAGKKIKKRIKSQNAKKKLK